MQPETLGNLRVASPCSVAWETMRGGDTVRVCDQCNRKVYHFASLTLSEARQVLAENDGHPCGVLYQRQDGTVLTKDCPVGLRVARLRLVRNCLVGAAIVLAILGLAAWSRHVLNAIEANRIVGKIG